MPTPAERRALFFVSALMVLGGAVRAYAALASPNGPSLVERAALDRQIQAVDSAKLAETARKKPAKRPRPRANHPVEPAIRAGSGSSTQPTSQRTDIYVRVPTRRRNTELGASSLAEPETHTTIDLDVAAAPDIERLPRVGPVLARRIVANRDSLGPFGSVQELTRVRGVGPALARILKPYVTFSLQPRPHRVVDPRGRETTRKARRGRTRVSEPP